MSVRLLLAVVGARIVLGLRARSQPASASTTDHTPTTSPLHLSLHYITLHYITTDHTPLIITLHYITLQLITAPRHHHFTYHWAPQRLHADHNTSQARMKVGRPILIVAIFVAYHKVRHFWCVVL